MMYYLYVINNVSKCEKGGYTFVVNLIAQKNPFFHNKVKSGRQVLKSSPYPFFLNTLTKINFFKC